jgi:hypothetical protein
LIRFDSKLDSFNPIKKTDLAYLLPYHLILPFLLILPYLLNLPFLLIHPFLLVNCHPSFA